MFCTEENIFQKVFKKNKKKVSFSNVINIIFIPSRQDFTNLDFYDLFYQQRDFKYFIDTYHHFKKKDEIEFLLLEKFDL